MVAHLLSWYRKNGRTLPWRNERNPYRVLISEVMLQQTQVSRVLEKYPAFIKRFPSFPALSTATRADVIRAWQGMGYNNRAVRLHVLAQRVVEEHKGRLPRSYDGLIALPGIGKYTAHAILSSVFLDPVPVVDVNVQRVLSRVFWRMRTTSDLQDERRVWPLAFALLPHRMAYDWNQAMMDLGATVCTARRPLCTECPVAKRCLSRTSLFRNSTSSIQRQQGPRRVPDRIFRGYIVEHLRRASGNGGVPLERLGKAVRPDFSPSHRAWFTKLLEGLRRDGLIQLRGTGTWKNRRAALA